MECPKKTRFYGVYELEGSLATKNNSPGFAVYDEKLVRAGGSEYRMWNPNRSKLAASILKGMKNLPIVGKTSVLYLGASYGTTPSHISDIASKGAVYCIEFSENSMRKLLKVCEKKGNMIPMLGDARKPEEYQNLIQDVDFIYQDVAQPDQAEILIRNSRCFLKKGDFALIAIKARSIDTARDPKEVFLEEQKRLSGVFDIVESIDISKYHKDHLVLLLRFRQC